MVLQASSGHELVDEKALLIFEAVTNKLYEIGVRQLAQVIHFGLQMHGRFSEYVIYRN